MEETKFNFPMLGTKFTLRSTDEEVELIDAEIKARGERNDEDWVTYIDSQGKEHIKEKLNIQLDFKPISNDVWNSVMAITKPKYPTTRNNRIFDVAKELIINGNRGYDIAEAVNVATNLVDKIGVEFE